MDDVNGNRELVGLSERLGDVVGVVVEERIGDEPFNLLRISCSYKERS